MNNYYIGIDIVQNKRLNNDRVLKRFLSKREYELYSNYSNKEAAINFAASRWAGKEAIIKAANKHFSFANIEILNDDKGNPIVYIDNKLQENIKISISHEKKYSVAFCLITGND